MDKNTIIGFLLIAAVMIVFMISQRPDAEQLAQRERMQDSIQRVEAEREKIKSEDVISTESSQIKVDTSDVLSDFFGEESFISEDTVSSEVEEVVEAVDTTSLALSRSLPEDFVTIENDDLRLRVSTKGGWMYSAELKDFKRYDKDTLFLFKGDEARFNLELFNKRSVRLNTESETFTPILSDNGKTLTMRL